MALRILWSQKEDPLNMKYCTLEGNNTLAEGVRDAEPPSKRKKIRNENNNDKDVEPLSKRKRIIEEKDDNNAKGQEGEEAASTEAEVEAEVDTETEEEGESGDSDEEPISSHYLRLLRKTEVKYKDSDLEFLAYEQDLVSYDDNYDSNDEQNFSTDYPDSQDLWESEDRRKSDYGFGADTEEDAETGEETETEEETEVEGGGVSGDSQDDEGGPWF